MKNEGLILMDQKFNTLQQILNEITKDSGFYGSIISSEEGLIILNSSQMDPKVEIESLAAKAASIFNEDDVVADHPEDITISYINKKIFIQKVSLPDNSDNYLLLITLMPHNYRYFRRRINKIINLVLKSC